MTLGIAILHMKHKVEQFRCPSDTHMSRFSGPDTTITNETIPTFYSEFQMEVAGWKFTKHPMFCEPGKSGVWVCPECASQYRWINHE